MGIGLKGLQWGDFLLNIELVPLADGQFRQF